jgi:hypothetical protein
LFGRVNAAACLRFGASPFSAGYEQDLGDRLAAALIGRLEQGRHEP